MQKMLSVTAPRSKTLRVTQFSQSLTVRATITLVLDFLSSVRMRVGANNPGPGGPRQLT